MKTYLKTAAFAALATLGLAHTASALDGEPYIHDPSNIMECDGKYYTFGTGGGGLISDDGWTWRSGAVRPGGGAAPDALKIGDRYLVGYSATGGGLGGGHAGRILTMWNKTLDPNSPDFEYTEPIEVAASLNDEDCDAIDIGLLLDPSGRLWCTYGTYFGFIRVVELDPKTGARLAGNEAVDIAIDCEATTMIYRDGWYYLLATHGTCCSGATSTYNIRVGRSKSPTGPFLDHTGMDMIRGGGKLVIAANNRLIGAGHFGLLDLGGNVQKFSCHYEADLDKGGRSVLDIRALLWKDGWPVAGDLFMGGTFEIESGRSGYALEMGVDAVPLTQGGRTRQMAAPAGEGGAARPARGAGGAPGGFPAGGAPGAGAPGGAARPAMGAAGAPGAGAPGGMMGMGGGAPGAGAPGGAARPAMGAGGAPGGGMGGFGGMGMGMGGGGRNSAPIPDQTVEDAEPTWPNKTVVTRLGDYMLQAHQKWTIAPVEGAGGYIGSPFFKITIEGTDRALTATEEGKVVVETAFTGDDSQLWRIDQLIDGSWRIMPKAESDSDEPMCLSAVGISTPSLAKYDPDSWNFRWNFKKP